MVYFTTELKNVYVDGVLYENAEIVNAIQEIPTLYGNCYELPNEYLGCIVIGTMYKKDTNDFIVIDDIKEEETQLDRIEKGTTQLLTDIKEEAVDEYTLELMESGVL